MTKRLLLVEDEAALARAVTRLLRRRGHEVFLAGTCEEARRATGTFSLAVFDIDLPDGDGISLAEELVASGTVRRVVFFSGTPDAAARERAAALGRFVEKGKGYPDLEAAIVATLRRPEVRVAGLGAVRIGDSSSPPPSGTRGRRGGG